MKQECIETKQILTRLEIPSQPTSGIAYPSIPHRFDFILYLRFFEKSHKLQNTDGAMLLSLFSYK